MYRESEQETANGHRPTEALLPFSPECVIGTFVQRRKRFSVELRLDGEQIWVHSNNSGSMLGLTRPGAPVLASPAANPARKLKYTQECVWLAETAVPKMQASLPARLPAARNGLEQARAPQGRGFWVGVNTSVPNRMLEAAFAAGRLSFAAGYTRLVRRGQTRPMPPGRLPERAGLALALGGV